MLENLFTAIVVLVAVEHLWFLVLEMFLWTRPIGLKTFRNTEERARESATLGLLHPDPRVAAQVTVFCLGCVVVAGVFGAITVSRRIFWIQALPALVGLGLAWLG
jgi:putative membrane protein